MLRIAPPELVAAREALAQERPIRAELDDPGSTDTHAPSLPISIRIAAFETELEMAIRSAVTEGASDETVDALLAVAVRLSKSFPDVP